MFFSSASYMDWPRIHFHGQFRADVATANNRPCNYDLHQDLNAGWNANGTNEFSFFNTKVTSMVSEEGSVTYPDGGYSVINNQKHPFAKLVDLDVDQQATTTVYGLSIGVAHTLANGSEQVVFKGEWSPSVLAQGLWLRMKCYDGRFQPYQGSYPLGASSKTIITDIHWGDTGVSNVLQQLHQASTSNGNKLSASIALYRYTLTHPDYVAERFTLGYVVGSIGPYQEGEVLNIGGPRWLMSVADNLPKVSFSEDDSCYDVRDSLIDYKPWLYNAPFAVRETNQQHLLTVDISNSLPIHIHGSLRDLGDLRIGIEQDHCVDLLSSESIPYTNEQWLENTGGLVDLVLTSKQFEDLTVKQLKLVLAQVVTGFATPICSTLNTNSNFLDTAKILLRESANVVRPTGKYVGQVDDHSPLTIQMYVTEFGQPSGNKPVQVYLTSVDTLPYSAVSVDSELKVTDENGMVSFTFSKVSSIPFPRQYLPDKYHNCSNTNCNNETGLCELPIEGQVYTFKYCIQYSSGDNCVSELHWPIVILGFSDFQKPLIPTWVDHIEPIFTQHKRLAPVMIDILDLSNYTDVTLLRNINLLKLAMKLDTKAANFMPVARNLSPKQTEMVLEWLDDPKYNETSYTSDGNVFATPFCDHPDNSCGFTSAATTYPRCKSTEMLFEEHPGLYDSYYSTLASAWKVKVNCKVRSLRGFVQSSGTLIGREQCTLGSLQEQLQTAAQIEFYTIPLYLTTLYSFVNNCNIEAVELMRSVVLQEMLHFTQIANMLVSTGKFPTIDNESFAPIYPHQGLPGCVLPNLYISLKRASLQHIYYTFMGIETPAETLVVDPPVQSSDTIGEFYDEIKMCINQLYDEGIQVFNPDRNDLQVQWPWNSSDVGELMIVDSLESALQTIDQIVTQGEGASLMSPIDLSTNTLAHFYRLEEIVCQHRLKKMDELHYAYTGDPIPFDAYGVWPMRDNPSASTLIRNSNCYTEAKAFHHIYRSLLRVLQDTFSGNPKAISDAVGLMEALKVHTKRLMWVKYHTDSDTTCGPAFDYEWPVAYDGYGNTAKPLCCHWFCLILSLVTVQVLTIIIM